MTSIDESNKVYKSQKLPLSVNERIRREILSMILFQLMTYQGLILISMFV